MNSYSKNVLALDFDGVICASSTESSVSSIVAAKKIWPTKVVDLSNKYEFEIIKNIVSDVRPIIETGYENILVVRYSTERWYEFREAVPDASNEIVSLWRKTMAEKIMGTWNPKFRDSLLAEYGAGREELVDLFGSTRDEMIQNDANYWIGLNGLYSTVSDTLRAVSCMYGVDKEQYLFKNLFIVTTKQQRFVKAILEMNDIHVIYTNGISNTSPALEQPDTADFSNIFDLDNAYGSKVKVLLTLTRRMKASRATSDDPPTIHFVEDRFETLINVLENDKALREQVASGVMTAEEAQARSLSHVQLYLADWGYNTEEQRNIARLKLSDRIKVISQIEFQELVQTVLP